MFKVYALKDCGFCKKAITELANRGFSFFYSAMDDPDMADTFAAIKEEYDWKTVPIIVKISEDGEKFIGGYTDLMDYFRDEEPTL